ncbi:MAG: AAA family ATPase [Campylobacter sp.]|nr:AAA family ATPase [Campylobacter sp.]
MSNLKEILLKFSKNKLNIILAILVLLIGLLSFVYFRSDPVYISKDEYQMLLNSGEISKADIVDDKIYLTYNKKQYIVLKDAVDLKELYEKAPISQKDGLKFFRYFVPICILLGLGFLGWIAYKRYDFRKFSDNLPTKTHALNDENSDKISNFTPFRSNVKFSDVAGIKDIKDELFEVVDFLKNSSKYKKYGINLPRGVLMVGPPGVGKTLIAKAVAGEAGVPFFYQSGASFSQMYVGVGAKRVKELFNAAKINAPSIIFIDEIDSVGKSRGDGRNDEREATLNELLTQMDGFDESLGVIVMGATNRIEMIDEALLRSGRFDRRVYLSLPDFSDRKEILSVHLKDKSCNVDLSYLSRISVGFSGAALATFVNEAAINAYKRGSDAIENLDFDKVKNKVFFGKKKALNLSENEKEIHSFYQAAKAVSAYWYDINFNKISIFEDDFLSVDKEIVSKTYLMNKIKVLISGKIATAMFRDDAFTNASDDIKKARMVANDMVYKYAMGSSIMPISKDAEDILKECDNEVREQISSLSEVITQVAKHIFVSEKIESSKVKEIVNQIYQKDENG